MAQISDTTNFRGILPQLAEAKIFSILNTKDGFHQVQLETTRLHSGCRLTICGCPLEYAQHAENSNGECT